MLIITDDCKRWHYLAAKSFSALLRRISSSNNGDFYCLNCFHSYKTHDKLKKHERVCNNHDYCHANISKEHEKIKYLPREKSLKDPFIIYADLECLLKKCDLVKIIPKILTQRKNVKRKPPGYAWCAIYSFDETKNRRYFYRGKDCIEKFCKDLKELGTEIINFQEKEMIPFTNKEIKSYEKQKLCHICESFVMIKIKKSQRSLSLHQKI